MRMYNSHASDSNCLVTKSLFRFRVAGSGRKNGVSRGGLAVVVRGELIWEWWFVRQLINT